MTGWVNPCTCALALSNMCRRKGDSSGEAEATIGKGRLPLVAPKANDEQMISVRAIFLPRHRKDKLFSQDGQ